MAYVANQRVVPLWTQTNPTRDENREDDDEEMEHHHSDSETGSPYAQRVPPYSSFLDAPMCACPRTAILAVGERVVLSEWRSPERSHSLNLPRAQIDQVIVAHRFADGCSMADDLIQDSAMGDENRDQVCSGGDER